MDADLLSTLTADALLDLGVDPEAVTTLQSARVARRIAAAENKVLGFLNRDSLEPETYVVSGLYWDDTYPENEVKAWPYGLDLPDRWTYVSKVANADDDSMWDVTFHVGLDLESAECAPIKEFLIADAVESLRGDPAFPSAQARVKSLSAGGQSVSYQGLPPTADGAGGLIELETLGKFKRFAVGRARGGPLAPWPYNGDRGRW